MGLEHHYKKVYKPIKVDRINNSEENKLDFKRHGGGGFRRDFGPREMHKATCAECGNECEVPFKPSGDKPVYCKECYMKKKKY